MTDHKVMQQALYALESAIEYTDSGVGSASVTRKCAAAISDLRAAIAQPEQTNPAPGYCKNCKDYTIEEPMVAQPEQTSPRGTDAQILKEREITTSAIVGAMAYGFQNGEYPPDDSAWLRPFWTMGRRDAEREAAIAQPEQPAPKITAYVTRHDDGDMLWFDKDEALDYCDEDSPPEPLVLLSAIAQPEQPATIPKPPYHPEPHTFTWSKLELEAITAYGVDCFKAGIAQPEQQTLSDLELTSIYDQANGHKAGKAKPITTQKIFAAMRACLAIAKPAPVRQPLTRKQLIEILANVLDPYEETFLGFARALEAAHGIAQTKAKP